MQMNPFLTRSVSEPLASQSAKTDASASALDRITESLNALLDMEPPHQKVKMIRSSTDWRDVKVKFFNQLDEIERKLGELEAKPVMEKILFNCSICFEAFESLSRLCSREICTMEFCTPCLQAYVNSSIKASLGMCPVLRCPGCNHFITFSSWKDIIDASVRDKYEESAKNILTLQCGRCHVRGSLLTAPIFKDEAERKAASDTLWLIDAPGFFGPEDALVVRTAFEAFCRVDESALGVVEVIRRAVLSVINVEIEEKVSALLHIIHTKEEQIVKYDEEIAQNCASDMNYLKEQENELDHAKQALDSLSPDGMSRAVAMNKISGLRAHLQQCITDFRKKNRQI